MRRSYLWLALLFFLLHPVPRLLAQVDTDPPIIAARYPSAGTLVQGLNTIEVIFNEDVSGVDASDLLINGVPATGLLFGIPGQFVFEFATPATGQVQVAFAPGHGITDTASPPNPFAGASWSYTFDPNSLPATFLITEFMAENHSTLNDENGDQSDWIEIYNPRPAAGSLEGWFLTDDAGNLTKWRFPNRTLEANAYLVVFASGKNRTNATGNLHTSFNLSSAGEYLALVDPNTNVVSAFSPVFPPQQPDVSYGRDRFNPNILGYFTKPTPRGPNSTGGAGFVSEVQFSRDSGTFPTNQPFALTLSTTSSNAVIYYAFGSNFPASNGVASFLYTGPIQVTNTVGVRARAYAPSLLPGLVTTKSYIALTTQTNVLNFNSDLPIMIIHTYGQGPFPASTTSRRYAFLQVFESNCGRTSMTNPPTLAVRVSAHARGSSTLGYAKVSLAVEIRDEFDDDLKVPLLGLPEESDWVLYAPNNFEPALFHNPLSHQLFRDQGKYGSRTRFVEVFLKDDSGTIGPVTSANFTSAANAGDYQGIYVLEERIKRDKNRVDVEKLEPEHLTPPEVTGGYIFSIDRTAPAEAQLSTDAGSFNWIEPSYLTMTNANRAPQVNYIRGYFNAFTAGINQNTYTNLNTTNHFSNYIDVDSWVTLHIHEVVTFNVDGLRLSGYFFKNRSKKFEYGPTWDYDRTEGSTDGRDFAPRVFQSTVGDLGTDFFNFTPWWNKLFAAPDFWQAWIDKYQYYRRPGKALSWENVQGRIDQLANELREAQPRELVRWGIAPRQGVITGGSGPSAFTFNFGTPSKYQNEIDFKYAWFSNRLDFIDTNFLAPPILSSLGGAVTNGYRITLNPGPKPGSSLIYTLDGTDPRAPGGRMAATAFSNLSSVTLTVTTNVHVIARSFNPSHRNLTGAHNPPISSPWSGPVDASLYSALPPLRITELMYHPPNPPAGITNSSEDFEYIEFTNIGGQPLNLSRFKLRGGVDFDFGNLTLNAGESGVLVRDALAFSLRYGAGPRILGVYTNDNLSNDGENLKLIGPMEEPILDFDYKDSWYPATDGDGFSLVIVNPNAPVDTWGLKESWRPSGILNGSPGSADVAAGIPIVYINEIMTHTDPPNFDAIELYNPGAGSVDLSGWYLTDNSGSPKKYRIPNGTSIGANGYMVFFATNVANPGLAFGRAFHLSSTGGEVYLYSANPATSNLTGYAHGFDFGPQANGSSFGRIVTSAGDQYPTTASPSLGGPNPGPKVGPVVISEVNYHPPDLQLTYRAIDNCIDEYVELQNISAAPVPLYDPLNPANTWKLRDAVSFQFPPNTTIPANTAILVVPIDPANVEQATAFRARNGVAANVALYGPWDGQLDNSGETLELARPDTPNPDGVPYILVERVKYSDEVPWPEPADGFGPVLQRISLTGFANDSTNWTAGIKTPGGPFNPAGGPSITQHPSSLTVVEGRTAAFNVVATGPAPLAYQWLFNGDLITGQTASSLLLNPVRLNQAGEYACLVYNASAAILSSPATLTINPLPRILQNPTSVALRGSTNNADYGFTTNNATFSVVATGTGDLHYQWRKNGVPIGGANGPILTLPNVDLSSEGMFDVVLSDDIDTLTSSPARLAVLLTPYFVFTPATNIMVASNSSFSASAAIRGNPPPFRFEWREVSSVRASNTTSETNNFFTSAAITNKLPTQSTTWRLVIFNDATPAQGIPVSFTVTALADTDGDGMPDDWETQYGFDPNVANNHSTDSDHDGISDYAEYLAGTNPTNAQSNLRVENISPSGGSAQITVGLLANHTYTLQSSPSLTGGPWTRVTDFVSRTQDRVETVVDSGPGPTRFYRLVTPRQ